LLGSEIRYVNASNRSTTRRHEVHLANDAAHRGAHHLLAVGLMARALVARAHHEADSPRNN